MDERIVVAIVLTVLITGLYKMLQAGLNSRRTSLLIRSQADLHTKLLDRLGSGRELVEFAQTDGGQRFIQSLSVDNGHERAGRLPIERILGSMQKGFVLSLLGIGFLALAWRHTFEDREFKDILSVLGVIALCLGVGFLISSGVSYRLSKQLGLIRAAESPKETELLPHRPSAP
jgi:hypothetical protein